MLEFLLYKIAGPKRAKPSACQASNNERKSAKLYLKKYNILFFMDSFFSHIKFVNKFCSYFLSITKIKKQRKGELK